MTSTLDMYTILNCVGVVATCLKQCHLLFYMFHALNFLSISRVHIHQLDTHHIFLYIYFLRTEEMDVSVTYV